MIMSKRAKKKKEHRRYIRLNGKLISQQFDNKDDADDWYEEMRRRKRFARWGIVPTWRTAEITLIDYARKWMKKRMKNYPASTWKSDEQRLRDYILPWLGNLPIVSITAQQVRQCLEDVTNCGRSIETRTRVKALLSVIFSDAMNESTPVVNFNPVLGIKFKDRRIGKKKPVHLRTQEDCYKLLEAAKEIGPTCYVAVSFVLMSGLRKQEAIAAKWRCFNPKLSQLVISEKLIQASMKIVPGTKAGELVERVVPIPKALVDILNEHRKTSKFNKDNDFIICNGAGNHYWPKEFYDLVMEASKKAQVHVHVHGLRHTYGREFVAKTGNVKALQAILGHSSSATTDIYSDLSGSRIDSFGESVSFNASVKREDKIRK